MNKPTITDVLTTILGAIILLWVIGFYSYSKMTGSFEFPPLHVAVSVAVSLFLIFFKGDAARDLLTKFANKIKK